MEIDVALKLKLIEFLMPYHPDRIGVFGSFARGENLPGSDLDVLISFSNPISLLRLVQLEQELSDALNIKVDLVTEKSLRNHRLRQYIERDLINIYG